MKLEVLDTGKKISTLWSLPTERQVTLSTLSVPEQKKVELISLAPTLHEEELERKQREEEMARKERQRQLQRQRIMQQPVHSND